MAQVIGTIRRSHRHNMPITLHNADHFGTACRHRKREGERKGKEPGTPSLRSGGSRSDLDLDDHEAGPNIVPPDATPVPAAPALIGALSAVPKSQIRTRPILQWLARWRESHSRHFPDVACASWTYDERNRIEAVARVWARDRSRDAFGDFLACCVEYWAGIRFNSFKWMRNPVPTTPSIRFLLSHRHTFVGQWNDEENHGEINARIIAGEREPGGRVRR